MTMLIHYDKKARTYWADATFEEKNPLKAAGFKWFPEVKIDGKRRWNTPEVDGPAQLRDHCDPEVTQIVDVFNTNMSQLLDASSARDSELDIPRPDGLEYLAYQKGGIEFLSERPNGLIGDVPGLGKTIQALGVINLDTTIRRVLIVVPASLKINWSREADKWLVKTTERSDWFIKIVSGRAKKDFPFVSPQACSIVIINYDILDAHHDALRAIEWDLLVADEVHKVKNPKAKRTKELLGWEPAKKDVKEYAHQLRMFDAKRRKTAPKEPKAIPAISARRNIFMTGTPIVNRPIELWPILSFLDPKTWNHFWSFATRFCDAKNNGFGWDLKGGSHLEELQRKLRSTIMIRRTKEEVLPDLPKKTRQIIEIAVNGQKGDVKNEMTAWAEKKARLDDLVAAVELAKALDDTEAYEAAVLALTEGETAAFEEMSELRHATAMAKVQHVIEHVHGLIDDDPDYRVVVFAHHHDVVDALLKEFGLNAMAVTGRTPIEKRQLAVDRFQAKKFQVFVGNIQAAGVGLTLTASSHVIFAELDWVPGNMSQAEDRCHRIGQTDNVLVQHIVLEGSMDATMANTLVAKQKIIDKALDLHVDPDPQQLIVPAVSKKDKPATAGLTRAKVHELAKFVPQEQVTAIHQILKALSSVCDGAVELDGSGFNGLDTRIGKSLASSPTLSSKQAILGQKVARKYRGQLTGFGLEDAYTVAMKAIKEELNV